MSALASPTGMPIAPEALLSGCWKHAGEIIGQQMQALDAVERFARAAQVVILARKLHEFDVFSECFECRVFLVGLVDGRADVVIAVDQQQWRVDPRHVVKRRLPAVGQRIVPRRSPRIVRVGNLREVRSEQQRKRSVCDTTHNVAYPP